MTTQVEQGSAKTDNAFAIKLEEAGLLGLPFSWTENGDFWFDESMVQEQTDHIRAIYAEHVASIE